MLILGKNSGNANKNSSDKIIHVDYIWHWLGASTASVGISILFDFYIV